MSTSGAVLTGLQLKAATVAAGFALQNATPTILTWTAPNDGKLHAAVVVGVVSVTVTNTGGQVSVTATNPTYAGVAVYGGGGAPGFFQFAAGTGQQTFLLAPNQTINLVQATALTVGAGVVLAQIYGN